MYRFISNMYISVSHINGRPIKDMIGVVMTRLVGMGLKVLAPIFQSVKLESRLTGRHHGIETGRDFRHIQISNQFLALPFCLAVKLSAFTIGYCSFLLRIIESHINIFAKHKPYLSGQVFRIQLTWLGWVPQRSPSLK